jgi:outer membrane receptor for ferrienterochelin and colicins
MSFFKKLYLCAGLFFAQLNLFGQQIKIVNLSDGLPVAYAQVRIIDIKNNKSAEHYTSEQGIIKASSNTNKPDSIVVTISAFGYAIFSDTVQYQPKYTFTITPENYSLDPVVLTGQYKETKAHDCVHKVSVIDRETIEKMGAITVKDALSNSMNIRFEQDGILGSSIQMQGIGGENVKILIDGVPVVGRQNGNLDLGQINLNQVERIEVIEGPMSVSYGTNALAGVINIITKKNQTNLINAGLSNYYESNGTYNQSITLGVKKKRFYFSALFSRNFFDGWNPTEKPFHIPKISQADSTRYQLWKAKEQYNAGFKTGINIAQSRLLYAFDYFDEHLQNRGMPRKPYFETAFDDIYKTNRKNHSLEWYIPFRKNNTLNLLVAFNTYDRIKNTYYNDLTELKKVLTTGDGDQDTTHIKTWMARGTYSVLPDSSKFKLELGYDTHLEELTGERILKNKQSLYELAFFASSEYALLENLKIRPGLRLAHHSVYRAPIIPSLNVLYNLRSFSIRASYGKGFRAPGIKELYLDFVDINHNIGGNPNLKAEYANNFQLGLVKPIALYQGNMMLEVNTFYNSIRNMISMSVLEATRYTYFNIGYFKSYGLNFNATQKWQKYTFSLGGGITGRENRINHEQTTSQTAYSPEFRSNASINLYRNLILSVFYKYYGKLPSYIQNTEGETVLYSAAAYNMADLSLSKSLFQQKINFTVGIKNLFNVQSITSTGSANSAHSSGSGTQSIAMGRTYFAKITYAFKK